MLPSRDLYPMEKEEVTGSGVQDQQLRLLTSFSE